MVRRPKISWSPMQLDVFRDFADINGKHTMILACAGAGKTATLIEGLKHLPRQYKRSVIMLAFNRSIAKTLREKAPSYVKTSTIHSICLAAIKATFGNDVKIYPNKTYDIICKIAEELGIKKQTKPGLQTIQSLQRAVSICKAKLCEIPSKIDVLIDNYGIDEVLLSREAFIKVMVRTLRLCREQTGIVDYDDMVYLACSHRLQFNRAKIVVCDEIQDMTDAQLWIVQSLCAPGGRIIMAGDKFQSLYSWMGSDITLIDDLIKRLNAKVLPLSISYRCPKSVVKLAQTIVPNIEAAANAKEGNVQYISQETMMNSVKSGDIVLSRLNAPLIYIALSLLKQKRRANIRGRDIGNNLAWLVKKSEAKNIGELIEWIENWKTTEVKKLEEKGRDTTLINDKYLCLMALCRDAKSVPAVIDNIRELFTDGDDSSRIICSTVHRFKGDQAQRVFVLENTLKRDTQEALNVVYVSYTRAQSELYLVS